MSDEQRPEEEQRDPHEDAKLSGILTRRVKTQLLVFVAITLVGVAYVGARYAQLDRVFLDQSYVVTAHLPDSGGAFASGEVTYRGVGIGRIKELVLVDGGVDAKLEIDNKWDDIPEDTLAIVGNRSALGEQYIELQPLSNGGPFLEEGSEIQQQNTRLPIPPVQLLADLSTTVSKVDRGQLQTVIRELGKAFEGTGDDLGQIIDTSNSFIETANENFEITASLIRDSRIVLDTQLDEASSIRTFARNLAAFSTTLAGSDADLRRLIDSGAVTANELRSFVDEVDTDLAKLLNNLRIMGDQQVDHLDGIEQLLVLYPYVVENGFSVVAKDPVTGKFDAHFGTVLTEKPLCHDGYQSTNRRPPQDGSRVPMNTNARCTEPATRTNARGAQHAPPRVAPAWAVLLEESWAQALLLPFRR